MKSDNPDCFSFLPKALIGYIAFDWLVDGRHIDNMLGPTFVDTDGTTDFFGPRVLNLVSLKRITLLDSTAMTNLHTSTLSSARQFFSRNLSICKLVAPFRMLHIKLIKP